MQKTQSLNGLYADFSAGLLAREAFEGAIFKEIQRRILLHDWPGFCRDDRNDYVSWLYPRIKRAINTYRETGASFDVYIDALIRLTAKEYRTRLARRYAAESTAWYMQIPEMYAHACEAEPQYDEKAAPPPRKIHQSRQHLILVLKCCIYIPDDFLESVSPRLGIEPQALRRMVLRLKEMRKIRLENINIIREKINNQLFRCLCYERSLRSLPEDSHIVLRYQEQLKKGRERLERLRSRLALLHPEPSNSQIAEVLGVTKGTVDSALHRIKLRNACQWDKASSKISLN